MVSVQTIKKQDTTTILADMVGISTDTKPTTMAGKSVDNGSTFIEMDTGKIYMYDMENEQLEEI